MSSGCRRQRFERYALAFGHLRFGHGKRIADLDHTRVFLRPVANPLALGFVGLAAASLVTSGIDLGWYADGERAHAAIAVLLFAPVLQLVSSVFGFLARDPVASTGMGILGGTWLVVGLTLLTTSDAATSAAFGTFLLVPAAALLLTAGIAAERKGLPAAVLALAGTRFLLSGLYHLSGGEGLQEVSGIVGLVLSALAIVCASSGQLEDVRHAPVPWMLRRGRGREVLATGLEDQARDVAREPGVREEI